MSNPNNLPYQLSSFIGREAELARLKELAAANRLVTLTGPGGIGKTRLSIQTARELLPAFPDGAWFIALAPVSDARLVPETVALALNFQTITQAPLTDLLIEYLQNKKLLLVLDNCEHVVYECARLTEILLAACPDLKIIATSREGLAIPGERLLRVPSLAVPETSLAENPVDLSGSEAVRLFLERARAVDPGFSLTGPPAGQVARICRRLDGIPLALELAAARLQSLPLDHLVTRLDDAFQVLTGGSRTALARQQTLQAAVDWSFNLLTEPERAVLRRLAVFAGKWSLDAVEAVCVGGDIAPATTVEIVTQLVNKSLIQFAPQEGYYYLLETIRQYARRKLEEAGEFEFFSRKYLDYFLDLAEEAARHLKGKDQYAWIKRLEANTDNIRETLGRFTALGEVAKAARLATAVSWEYWYTHVPLEGLGRIDQILDLARTTTLSDSLKAGLLNLLGVMNHTMGHPAKGLAQQQAAFALWKNLGDQKGMAKALLDMGWNHMFEMQLDEVARYAQASLIAAEASRDQWSIAAAYHLKAISNHFAGKDENALAFSEMSAAIWRQLGDRNSLTSAIGLAGRIELKRGNYERLKPWLAETMQYYLESENRMSLAFVCYSLAELAVKNPDRIQGAAQAARLLGQNDAWYEGVRGARSPIGEESNRELEKTIVSILGEESYNRERQAGIKLSRPELLALVQQVTRPAAAPIPQPAPAYPAGLTEREAEVLRLLAAGLSNPEIADKLVVSRRTVDAHLRSIFAKLEVTTRTAAAHFATQNKLI